MLTRSTARLSSPPDPAPAGYSLWIDMQQDFSGSSGLRISAISEAATFLPDYRT